MADEGVEHCGQGDVARCEVTRTSTSSGVSLTEVISRPSGKGNNGDEGINLLEKRFLCWLEQIFGRSLRLLRLLHQKVGRANYTQASILWSILAVLVHTRLLERGAALAQRSTRAGASRREESSESKSVLRRWETRSLTGRYAHGACSA